MEMSMRQRIQAEAQANIGEAAGPQVRTKLPLDRQEA